MVWGRRKKASEVEEPVSLEAQPEIGTEIDAAESNDKAVNEASIKKEEDPAVVVEDTALFAEEVELSSDGDNEGENTSEQKQSYFSKLWRPKQSSIKDEETPNNDIVAAEATIEIGEDVQEEETSAGSSSQKEKGWKHRLWRANKSKDDEEPASNIEVEISNDNAVQVHDKSATPQDLPPPFPRQKVHEEALEMLTASLLIYIFADLRAMVKEGKIQSEELLETPISAQHVMQAIQTHREALAERAIDSDDIENKLTELRDTSHHGQHMQLHQQQQAKCGQPTDTPISDMMHQAIDPTGRQSSFSEFDEKRSVLAQFHDETTTQGVVYGIAINHEKRRITVIFRGSVTQQDFVTDAKSAQKTIPNPVVPVLEEVGEASASKAQAKINIHTGFYQYLFRKDKTDGTVRLDRIMEDVKTMWRQNPGHRLFVTGHSLGGALATLFGFFAAIDNEFCRQGPVVVYSIASPQVGGSNFCEAFLELEKLNRLQHLRISNKEDMITHLPFLTLKATALSPLFAVMMGPGNLYKHCGINLEMKSLAPAPSETPDMANADAEEAEETRDVAAMVGTTAKEEEQEVCQHYCHSIYHSMAQRTEKVTYTEEFKRSLEAAKHLVDSLKPMAKADFDSLTDFHSCREYESRLMATMEFLSQVSLDQLYQDEGIVGKQLSKQLSRRLEPGDE